MAPFSLSWNSFDILRLLRSQEDPFELPGFVSTSPCDGTALPALEAGNELDHTNEYANIFSVDLYTVPKWKCVCRYINPYKYNLLMALERERERDLFFCHRRAEGLLVFHGFTSMHIKMWIHIYGGQDGLNYLGGGRLGEHKCNTNNLSNWYLFNNTLHTHTHIYQ